jgi:rubrerythrin
MTEPLTLQEALKTAIEYETRVRDLYQEAVGKATEDIGRRIFQTLANEEQGHLDYLESRVAEWEKTGSVVAEEVETVLPSPERITEGVAALEKTMEGRDWSVELELLRRALQAETETGDFYRRMVGELPPEHAKLFRRFMEIEDGHQALVQAEIDALSGSGFWFDSMEFRPEAG